MFNLFKKKNKPAVCNHKWKDFPWYALWGREDGRYYFKIFEPYVCIKCKERRDELLTRMNFEKSKDRDEELKKLHEKYKGKILDLVEVEDMVKDEQLVDREYLKLLEEFEHPEDKFANLDLFSEIQHMKKEVAAIGLAAKVGE